mmetsp:Transcript_21868/g.38612  ORF Transcript_21868/g.38612 Transcript_21868/m.38612 type:complete len:229 (+) Transcript_21868:264-950(+)
MRLPTNKACNFRPCIFLRRPSRLQSSSHVSARLFAVPELPECHGIAWERLQRYSSARQCAAKSVTPGRWQRYMADFSIPLYFSQKPVVPGPAATSFFQLLWHSFTTPMAACTVVGVSLASTFTSLPSVVLYILSHSTSFSTMPGITRGRSAADESWAASGSSRAITMILWSSSPWSMSCRSPNTFTGLTSPTLNGVEPISITSRGSLSPDVPLKPFTAGSSHVWGSMP